MRQQHTQKRHYLGKTTAAFVRHYSYAFSISISSPGLIK